MHVRALFRCNCLLLLDMGCGFRLKMRLALMDLPLHLKQGVGHHVPLHSIDGPRQQFHDRKCATGWKFTERTPRRLRFPCMRENLIPLLWDNGKVAGIAADTRGMLRPRPPFDEELAREIEFAKCALRCPTLAQPFDASPSIDAVEITALLDELEWHRR
jgi:hypothetical protein